MVIGAGPRCTPRQNTSTSRPKGDAKASPVIAIGICAFMTPPDSELPRASEQTTRPFALSMALCRLPVLERAPDLRLQKSRTLRTRAS
jgi:hypothetical protein